MNRCTAIDTLLPHKIELTKQYVELINSMVHREYENNYPQWSDDILSIAQQIYKIDPRCD